VADEIYRLRELRQNALVENAVMSTRRIWWSIGETAYWEVNSLRW